MSRRLSWVECIPDSPFLISGGWRAAKEKGDVRGSSSLFHHGDLSGERWRPKHPSPGALRVVLCYWSHHWQAAPVDTNGQSTVRDGCMGSVLGEGTCQRWQLGCSLDLCWFLFLSAFFLFILFFNISGNIMLVCMENNFMCKKKTKEGHPKLNFECKYFCHRSCLFFLCEKITTSDLPSIPSF